MNQEEIQLHNCVYGCGRKAKHQLKNGKFCCSKNIAMCSNIKEKLRKINNNKKLTSEHKEKIGDSVRDKKKPKYKRIINDSNICYLCGRKAEYQLPCGKYCCSDSINSCIVMKQKNSKSNTGKKRGPEFSRKMKESLKGKDMRPKPQGIKPIEGVLCDYGCEELAKFMFKNGKRCCSRLPHKCLARRKENRKRMIKESKRRHNDLKFIEKMRKSLELKPNKPETVILNLLNDLFPNEWKYVGDYKLWIEGENPDFVNKSDTKLIEHFGIYWHGKERIGNTKDVHESERIKHFRKYGDYDTLVIWEDELQNVEQLINKIEDFNSRNLIQLCGGTNH